MSQLDRVEEPVGILETNRGQLGRRGAFLLDTSMRYPKIALNSRDFTTTINSS
jgi:hypothetical protein